MASERFNLWAAQLILGSLILGGASPLLGADRSATPGAAVQPQSGQVQTSPVQPSDKPKVFGVKPLPAQKVQHHRLSRTVTWSRQWS